MAQPVRRCVSLTIILGNASQARFPHRADRQPATERSTMNAGAEPEPD